MEGDALANWLRRARAGKLTASRMRDAMDLKNGQPSAKRLAVDARATGRTPTGDSVRHQTDAMARGLEREAEAKAAYEAETGVIVGRGFYDHPRIDNLGATPDGLRPAVSSRRSA